MGIYEGVPTSIYPHSTSGRCDYWGPFVNRAARFGNSAAHGGQIVAPLALAAKLVTFLTGQQLLLNGHEPVLLEQPDFVPQRLQPSAAVDQGAESKLVSMRSARFKEPRRTAEVGGMGPGLRPGSCCVMDDGSQL